MLRKAGFRIYQNFLMPSRLGEYERLLKSLMKEGYNFLTVADLADCAKGKALPPLACILRVDVDSDIRTARQMFAIERVLAVRTTYYFRVSTFDAELMRRMTAYGSEVGYHYEELATVAKRLGLRDKADLDANISQIRKEFATNIEMFAEYAGHLPTTISSHGDFINRRLGVSNYEAIDAALRERFGIVAEAYDEWLNATVQARFSDWDPPNWWRPCAPVQAISRRVPCLYLLLHPRQWQASVLENLRLDTERLSEDLLYRARSMARGKRLRSG
jgi:hypothetical protein